MVSWFASVFRQSALLAGLAIPAVALSVGTALAQPKGSAIVAVPALSQNTHPTAFVSTADFEARKRLLQNFARMVSEKLEMESEKLEMESEKLEMVPLFWCATPYAVDAKRV